MARFEPGDLLFRKGKSWLSRAIKVIGVSPYSHVGMLVRREGAGDGWAVLDVRERRGGSSRPLRKVIQEQPYLWHHFKSNRECKWPDWDREAAVRRMWDFDDVEYGNAALWKASFIYLPGIRLFQKIDKLCIDDERTKPNGDPAKLPIPPYCSMACAIAINAGGVDPVPLLRHSMTPPGELSRSLFVERLCELVPDESYLCGKAAA